MQRLRVLRKAASLDDLELVLEPVGTLPRGPEDVLIDLRYAGVNPSDVRATMGVMPRAVWPRTPGRDWSGVVLEGPADLVGQQVFGTGGDLGITRDGSHGARLVVPRAAAVPKPPALSLAEAGALGVPFVTAAEGFRHTGAPHPGDVVLVMAVNGKVGQAAAQIAAWRGARVFGVTRRAEPFAGPDCVPVRMIDSASVDVVEAVRAETGGHGADIVVNTIGSPYFAAANAAMAHGARQILMSTRERSVPFDIFTFYRGRHSFFGIDTLALDATQSAAILRDLLPGFASLRLRPFPVRDESCFPLTHAIQAYRAVLDNARDRVVLRLSG
ncbi:MAG TPA: zinc-binding alcohol dehydrogenase family protein [Acetobacteraceae bacterium]|nr:zinc-binding alcohol dehydrogenase family protein [Acetobacteraceae bacterium]